MAKLRRDMKSASLKVAGSAAILSLLASNACHATDIAAGINDSSAPVMSELARNQHKFTMKFDYYNFINGGWQGDARFTISACTQPSCFRLSGALNMPINPANGLAEGAYLLPGLPCALRFAELPNGAYDSGDYRITPISRDPAKKGCASLPAGLSGDYRQLIQRDANVR
jgi:hypothetical protein